MDPDRKRRQQEAYDLQMWGATEVRGAVQARSSAVPAAPSFDHAGPTTAHDIATMMADYRCFSAGCGAVDSVRRNLAMGRFALRNLTILVRRYGLIFTTTLHHTWPLFRRQTLAGKAFVVSGFTIFGVSIVVSFCLHTLS